MAILITADFQASIENLDACRQVANRAEWLVKERGLSAVIVAGDMKKAYNPVDLRVTEFWLTVIEQWRKRCEVLLVMGNHDRTSLSVDDSEWLRIMERAGARVFCSPSTLELDGRSVAILPYCRTVEVWKQSLKYIEQERKWNNKSDLLVFHQNLLGARYHSKARNDDGKFELSGIPGKFLACVGGDIHWAQKMEENVWYAGSPFPTDWGEVNQKKYFCVLDKQKVRFLPTGMPRWYDPEVKGFEAPQLGPSSLLLHLHISHLQLIAPVP